MLSMPPIQYLEGRGCTVLHRVNALMQSSASPIVPAGARLGDIRRAYDPQREFLNSIRRHFRPKKFKNVSAR